jgi:hypothetical protein
MTYKEIGEWFEDCRELPDGQWDDVHLFTGEEGAGKSRKMRQIAARLDKGFSLERIHFTQDEFLNQAATLNPGDAIVLDEWRGHKRLAMHGERMEFLDFMKECRGLGLHMLIGFPHVDQAERDFLFQRVRWWNYSPDRFTLQVRKRISSQRVGKDGLPETVTKFNMNPEGRFMFPPDAPDPLEVAYNAKKYARMRDRAARYRESHGKELPTPQGRRPEENPRLNLQGALLLADLAQKELRAAP